MDPALDLVLPNQPPPPQPSSSMQPQDSSAPGPVPTEATVAKVASSPGSPKAVGMELGTLGTDPAGPRATGSTVPDVLGKIKPVVGASCRGQRGTTHLLPSPKGCFDQKT